MTAVVTAESLSGEVSIPSLFFGVGNVPVKELVEGDNVYVAIGLECKKMAISSDNNIGLCFSSTEQKNVIIGIGRYDKSRYWYQ